MIKDKKGDTMISVMVAFVMLLMGIAMIMQANQMALKLMIRAEEIKQQEQTAIAAYYSSGEKTNPAGDISAVVSSKDSQDIDIRINLIEGGNGEPIAITPAKSSGAGSNKITYRTTVIPVKVDGKDAETYQFYRFQ